MYARKSKETDNQIYIKKRCGKKKNNTRRKKKKKTRKKKKSHML